MCDEQLPDGVMRMYEDGCGHFAESDECVTLINTPRDIRPITVVEGHGQVREMWEVAGIFHRDYSGARDHACGFLNLIRRCIVIEMDNAATPQKGHQP